MSKPLLQVALDNLDIPSALSATRALAAEVDVLEVGTHWKTSFLAVVRNSTLSRRVRGST